MQTSLVEQVRARNNRGQTALHFAAQNRLSKAIDVMLSAGCDPLIKDEAGRRPIDLVADDDSATKQLLQTAMAEREKATSDATESARSIFSASSQRRLLPPLSKFKCIPTCSLAVGRCRHSC